jgi:hypothetical protein
MNQKRVTIRALLILLSIFAAPRDSQAFFGWIEQLSGPGPFAWVTQFPFDRLACVVRTPDTGSAFVHTLTTPRADATTGGSRDNADVIRCLSDDPKAIKMFFSAELGVGASDRNVLFADADDDAHRVRMLGFKALAFYRATPFLDLGGGIGVNRFSGRDFDRFYRVSIPLRARVVPAGFADGNSRWRAFYVTLQTDYFPAAFTSENFGAPGDWRESHEFLNSYFLGVDVLRLVR